MEEENAKISRVTWKEGSNECYHTLQRKRCMHFGESMVLAIHN